MAGIHEEATLTSKGQITLPKAIRQILGLDRGGKVAFELRGDEVIVFRAEAESEEDPAIARFLSLIEEDIRQGRHVVSLPEDLKMAMSDVLSTSVDVDERIEGDVDL